MGMRTSSLVAVCLHVVVLSLFQHHGLAGLRLKVVPQISGPLVGVRHHPHVLGVGGGAEVESTEVV